LETKYIKASKKDGKEQFFAAASRSYVAFHPVLYTMGIEIFFLGGNQPEHEADYAPFIYWREVKGSSEELIRLLC
jgi:hypothetical protein